MCGITAGIGQRNIAASLLEGLKRLEYRGYDSAGLAVLNNDGSLERLRICGKVNQLVQAHSENPLLGNIGIAHTRWATHGKPNETNAHPHMYNNEIALVHNGIIENYLALRDTLEKRGVHFTSQTDTEVLVQWIGFDYQKSKNLLLAVQSAIREAHGAYSIAVVSKESPDRIIAARVGAPLVIGVGENENYVASDSLALLPITQNFVTLEDGDVAEIFASHYVIYDRTGNEVVRPVRKVEIALQSAERGKYRHYMQKEIFEQPEAIGSAIAGRLNGDDISDLIFGANATEIFDKTKAVQIAACGTSFHAGLLAKHWIEQMLGIPCQVEVASELRTKKTVVAPGTLFVSISQSGETADTLGVLKNLTRQNYAGTLAICNVPESAIVRASELVLLTQAGPEIGVATTKGFTTQCVALLMLIQCLGRRFNKSEMQSQGIVQALRSLPGIVEKMLERDEEIAKLSQRFDDTEHTLFVGRGIQYPIAKEGALKLMEISYIHAQAYPMGELKHGPLALVDKHMPVIALVPKDKLLEKSMSNLQEIAARQGALVVFTEKGTGIVNSAEMVVIEIPAVGELLAPIAFTILLQLLAYHVALRKGTDVDQPRNLAKSVTVE
jgi:glucosamine--fructose-6-phosphate aminotransferase (isomerizing)